MQNPNQYAPCPKCGQSNAKKVGYTWWGGMLGPSMFTHVRCLYCNTEYNGKTGQSNQQNIIIYVVVSILISFCICGGFALLGALANQ